MAIGKGGTGGEVTVKAKAARAGGRAPGTPNAITKDTKQAILEALTATQDKLAVAMLILAETDPEKFVARYGMLAEFVAPKLARNELTSPEGQPFEIVVNTFKA